MEVLYMATRSLKSSSPRGKSASNNTTVLGDVDEVVVAPSVGGGKNVSDAMVSSFYKKFESSMDKAKKSGVIPTGSIFIDYVTGINGIPRGKVVEIYGFESSGKTTLSLSIAAECQKQGGKVAYLDVENAMDFDYASRIGIDTDPNKFLLVQPDTVEEVDEMTTFLLDNNMVDLVILDSLAALTTKDEIEKNVGDSKSLGDKPKKMAHLMRKLVGQLSRTNTTLIVINHASEIIGGMPSFGPPPVTTPGGRALKYASSIRLELKYKGSLDDNVIDEMTGEKVKTKVGIRVEVKAVKNKCAPPQKSKIVSIRFGEGFDAAMELIDIALEQVHVQKLMVDIE